MLSKEAARITKTRYGPATSRLGYLVLKLKVREIKRIVDLFAIKRVDVNNYFNNNGNSISKLSLLQIGGKPLTNRTLDKRKTSNAELSEDNAETNYVTIALRNAVVDRRFVYRHMKLELSNKMLKQLLMLPKVIKGLAEMKRETAGERGVELEYHQMVPLSAAFGGIALVRFGQVGISHYMETLRLAYNTENFDLRQEIKFGRRAGKTFTACLIIACILATQPGVSGIFICKDATLASTNKAQVLKILEDILRDKSNGIDFNFVSGEPGQIDIVVEHPDGTKSRCLFGKDPMRSNFRGQGQNKGFCLVDESDFYSDGIWPVIQPIWTMDNFVALYSSQGTTLTMASRMTEKAVLPNGRYVWRRYRIMPGQSTLWISKDYIDKDGKTFMDILTKGLNASLADKERAAAVNAPLRFNVRPWHNPIFQTLATKLEKIRLDEEKANARIKSSMSLNKQSQANNKSVSASPYGGGKVAIPRTVVSKTLSNAASATSDLIPKQDSWFNFDDDDDYDAGDGVGNKKTKKTSPPFSIKTQGPSDEAESTNASEADRWLELEVERQRQEQIKNKQNILAYNKSLEDFVYSMQKMDNSSRAGANAIESDDGIPINEQWNTAECLWLGGLGEHQPPNNMAALKATMTKEAFQREIQNLLPEDDAFIRPSFSSIAVDALFSNRVSKTLHFQHPIRFIVGYDPNGGGKSETSIVSGMFIQAGNYNSGAPRAVSAKNSIIHDTTSASLKQTCILTGIDTIPGTKGLDMEEVAKRILSHMITLRRTYSNYSHVPIIFIPEKNMKHPAYRLPLELKKLMKREHYRHLTNVKILFAVETKQEFSSLAGVHMSHDMKQQAVSRIGARLDAGGESIALSAEFFTNTINETTPSQAVSPMAMAEKFRDQLSTFQTIPPHDNVRCFTFSGKGAGTGQDDCVCALLVMEQGNAECERQIRMFNGRIPGAKDIS